MISTILNLDKESASAILIDTLVNTVVVNITVVSCPVGFQRVKNRCECDYRLEEIFDGIKCDIISNSIL